MIFKAHPFEILYRAHLAVVGLFLDFTADRQAEDRQAAPRFPDRFEAVLNDLLCFRELAARGSIGDRRRGCKRAAGRDFTTQ
jgi:hypothetical protein